MQMLCAETGALMLDRNQGARIPNCITCILTTCIPEIFRMTYTAVQSSDHRRASIRQRRFVLRRWIPAHIEWVCAKAILEICAFNMCTILSFKRKQILTWCPSSNRFRAACNPATPAPTTRDRFTQDGTFTCSWPL